MNKNTFFKNAIKTNQCWYWLGLVSGKYGKTSSGKWAHRIAWELTHKIKIPKGMDIRHLCHTPLCVNPSHLKYGTRKQNFADSRLLRIKKCNRKWTSDYRRNQPLYENLIVKNSLKRTFKCK